MQLLVTPALATALPPCCCSPAGTCRSSPCIWSVDLTANRDAAGLCCVAWPCRAARAYRHSQWIPLADLVPVQRVVNADPALRSIFSGGSAAPAAARTNVELWEDRGGCGRFVTAKRSLQPGECALRASAFAVVVRQARERCHWCFAPLRKKAFQCADCQFSRYCSRECLSSDDPLHAFQCCALKALAAGQKREQAFGIDGLNCPDWEAVRLTLAVLSMEALLGPSEVLSGLVTNNQSWIDESATAKTAVRIISRETTVRSEKHILRTLRRVQCNAHPMCVESNTVCGVGVFPEAAMTLNHSCLPNVVPSFDPQTRTLSFYAIRDIPTGHTIEHAYIDIMQSREQRQRLLLDGFGFRCSCVRCFEQIQRGVVDTLEVEKVGKAVVTRLVELTAAPQLSQSGLDRAFAPYRGYFEQHDDAAFAFHMLELKHARSRRDWDRVVTSAETLIELWAMKSGLPEMHPTIASLHDQIAIAAAQMALTEKAKRALQQAEAIRHLCGFRGCAE